MTQNTISYKNFHLNLLIIYSFCFSIEAKHDKIQFQKNDTSCTFSGKVINNMNFSAYASLLNNNIPYDKSFSNNTTVDLSTDIFHPCVECKLTVRSRATWGNSKSVPVVAAVIKDVDVVSDHKHFVQSNVIWVREAWIKFDLNNNKTSSLTIGSFNFELGRGIALGSSYAVMPDSLGFYNNNSSDQYAYGIKFSHEIIRKNILNFDLYGSILTNKSLNFSDTAAQINGQAYGGLLDPQRGFGKIDFLLASRLLFTPFDSEKYKLTIEPYVLYNNAPEQQVEFLGDSSSVLSTVGMGFESVAGPLEFGFEGARNFGYQNVKGWDSNIIKKANRDGYMVFTYSDIYDSDPANSSAQLALYDSSKKDIIKSIQQAERSANVNGKLISGTTLYNSKSRFQDAYKNKYAGFMFVADMSYWIYKDKLCISFASGIASGDQDPHRNLNDPNASELDGIYSGFISLHESYSGKRVNSSLILAGSIARPLSFIPEQDQYAVTVDWFSNIIFSGCGFKYKRKYEEREFSINPNILLYWQHDPSNKFDIKTLKSLPEKSNPFLGIEMNIFCEYEIASDIKLNGVFGLFKPGTYYYDNKGKPLNSEQKKIIDKYDASASPDLLPILGTSTTYMMSAGLTYKF